MGEVSEGDSHVGHLAVDGESWKQESFDLRLRDTEGNLSELYNCHRLLDNRTVCEGY